MNIVCYPYISFGRKTMALLHAWNRIDQRRPFLTLRNARDIVPMHFGTKSIHTKAGIRDASNL